MDFYSYVLIAIWLIGLWLLGWLVLPLSRRIFTNLPDGGLAAGRMLAIALLSLLIMWLGVLRLAPLMLAPLWFVGLPLLCTGRTLARPARRAEFAQWIKSHRRALLFSDAVFVAAFALFVWARACHPHLNEFEKPMDSAIMGSLARTQFLPADNPWFSGTPFTNYYYFGHLMGANLARLFSTPIALAYNLIVPAFCAFFISALWSLCAALTGSNWRGTLAMSIVALFGHFEPLRQYAKNGHWWPLDWWSTSRVIDTSADHTINEFPIFTLTLGDAHAHFFALALASLFFCLCWALFAHRDTLADKRFFTPRYGVLLLIGLLLGIFVMTNTWDAPTYGGLALLCALLTLNWQKYWSGELWPLLSFPIAIITALPYLRTFKSQVRGVGFELWTPPGYPFWLLWCGFLMLWCLVLGITLLPHKWEEKNIDRPLVKIWYTSLTIFILSWIGLAFMGGRAEDKSFLVWAAILSLFVPTAYLAFAPIMSSDRDAIDSTRVLRLLAFVGLLALLAPMLFYIKGAFADQLPYRHQDTVFKYVLQAWLLLGTAAACGVIAWWATLRGKARWIALVAFIVAWSTPVLCATGVVWARTVSSAQRDADGKMKLSLDGARYLPPADRAAIAWLSSHAKAGDTVLEAVGEKPEGAYNEFGRVATLTGVPTPLGWPQHAMYWGADYGKDVIPRWEAIRRVYQWPNDQTALAALQQLGVRYIFAGELERNHYGLPPLERMRKALPVVFENGETFIVAVPQNATVPANR